MSDFKEFTKIITTWKDQSKKTISDILKRIDAWDVDDC